MSKPLRLKVTAQSTCLLCGTCPWVLGGSTANAINVESFVLCLAHSVFKPIGGLMELAQRRAALTFRLRTDFCVRGNLVMGTVAKRMLAECKVPVLLVRPFIASRKGPFSCCRIALPRFRH